MPARGRSARVAAQGLRSRELYIPCLRIDNIEIKRGISGELNFWTGSGSQVEPERYRSRVVPARLWQQEDDDADKKSEPSAADRRQDSEAEEVAYFAGKQGSSKEEAAALIDPVGTDRDKLNAAAEN